MSDEPYVLWFLTGDISTDAAEQAVSTCLDAGFSLAGSQDVEAMLVSELVADRESALAELQYVDSLSANLSFNLGSGWDWNGPRLLLSFSTMAVSTDVDVNPAAHTRSRVQERVAGILDVVTDLVTLTDPEYVWGMLSVGQNPDSGYRPPDRPISANIDRFGWITALAEPIVTDLGGRNHVLEAPAWSVEELETGHLLILGSDNPVDPTYTPSRSLEAYLLESGSELDSGTDELAREDPFRSLSDGELGADVVMDPALVGTEYENDDLTLVQCRRDGDVLRDAHTGEVIRRIYETDDPATGAGSPAQSEWFTPLLLAEIPPEFVRLRDPDDDNVVTKLMALDVDVDKLAL